MADTAHRLTDKNWKKWKSGQEQAEKMFGGGYRHGSNT